MFTKDKNVFLDTNLKTKKELFEFIADRAMELNVIKSKEDLITGFVNREAQSTTGFEDGFAIPHARVETVTKSTVFVFRNVEKFEDYDAIDGGGVKYAIALLIPAEAGEDHMAILSSISMKLLDEQFRNTVKTGDLDSVFAGFDEIINDNHKEEATPEVETDKLQDEKISGTLISGISACPAGVAKTFMAKEKMAQSAKALNIDIEWETQGGGKQKDKLSDKAIADAEVILITSDIDIELDRFIGKRLFVTTTTDAIKNGEKLLEKALKEAKVYNGETSFSFKALKKKVKETFTTNFNVSWPYLGIASATYALFALLGFTIFGDAWREGSFDLNPVLASFQALALLSLMLVTPMLVYNMVKTWTKNGESAVIAMVATLAFVLSSAVPLAGNNINAEGLEGLSFFYRWNDTLADMSVPSVNLIAAIFITTLTIISTTFVEGTRVHLKKNAFFNKHFNKYYSPWIAPLFNVVVVFGLGVFLMGGPLTWLNDQTVVWAIEQVNHHWYAGFILGGIIVALINWDLGGTVNKITLVSLIALGAYDLRLSALIAIGIPIASIGLGLTHKLSKKSFIDSSDEALAGKSFRMGLNGMSEGPLPLTVKYGWRVKLPNLLSSFIAGGLSLMLGLMIFKGGHLGILGAGGQGFLAIENAIEGLRVLLPVGRWFTPFAAIAYGIIGYYVVMTAGAITYVIVARITFALPGKNKIFGKKD